MSKAEISYYDWELTFRKKPSEIKNSYSNKKSLTSTGIDEVEFKKHLAEWKKKNL